MASTLLSMQPPHPARASRAHLSRGKFKERQPAPWSQWVVTGTVAVAMAQPQGAGCGGWVWTGLCSRAELNSGRPAHPVFRNGYQSAGLGLVGRIVRILLRAWKWANRASVPLDPGWRGGRLQQRPCGSALTQLLRD